jgi:isopenicillin N synthase-like dioxygenase
MAPPSTPALPIIDISPFLPTTNSTPSAKAACAQALHTACNTHGFFYLTNHGIPAALTTSILSLARQFFLNTSPSSKVRIARRHARGWQQIGENVTQGLRDMHEAIDFYREVDDMAELADGPLGGANQWPEEPPELRGVYEEYLAKVLNLGEVVVRAMGYAFGPEHEEIFLSKTRNSFWVLRMIGYPSLQSTNSSSGISCGEHTDYGCTTFLLADPDVKGALQVLARDGSMWLDADPIPGAFVVNIGDMIERWTNGLWPSTRHRVIHRGDGYRVSVPFFYEPDFYARYTPPFSLSSGNGKKDREAHPGNNQD